MTTFRFHGWTLTLATWGEFALLNLSGPGVAP